MPQLEPGNRPIAALQPAPARGQGRYKPEPPAALGVTASRVQRGYLRTAAVGDLHPDHAAASCHRNRDRPAGLTRPAVPHAVAEQLADEQGGVIPARVLHAENTAHELPDGPRALHPPSHRHTPGHCSGHLCTAFPPVQVRGTPMGRGQAHGDARSTLRCASSRTTPLEGPSVAVRGKPTVHADRANRQCRRSHRPRHRQ
jgi:hypothetical protein